MYVRAVMLLRSIPRLLSCQLGRKYHSMASPLPNLAIFEAISNHEPRNTAIVHASSGRRFAYGELLRDVADASNKLLQSVTGNNLDGQRVAFLTENSYDYVGMIFYFALDELLTHSTLNVKTSHTSFNSWEQCHCRTPCVQLPHQ